MGVVAILAADPVFPLIFGSKFIQSTLIFQLLVPYFVLTLVSTVFTFTLIATENEGFYTRALAVGAVGFFAIILLPLPLASSLQVPLALTVFQAVSLVAMLRRVRDIVPVDLLRPVLVPLLTSTAVVAILSAWQQETPVIPLVLSIVVGLPLVGWSAGVTRKDVLELKRTLV